MSANITKENYFSFPAVNNSGLTDLQLELSTNDVVRAYNDAFRMGTLLDAMCLWPGRVDYLNRKVIDAPYNYTPKEFDHYRRMRDAFFGDSFVKEILPISELQKPFFNIETPFFYNGVSFILACKNLYDGYMPSLKYGWDLKKTKATNHEEFIQSVKYFSYNRQGVFYCNNSQSDTKHVIIGVSEVNLKVFHVLMDAQNDHNELWKEGREEMNYLAFRHYMLK